MFKNNFKVKEIKARELILERKNEYDALYSTQIKNTLEEKGISEEVVDNANSECTSGYFQFNKNEYSFITFKEVTFGNGEAAAEDAFFKALGMRFYYCNFTGCCFSNMNFAGCQFIGCKFSECITVEHGVAFENCNFIRSFPGKKNMDDMFASFISCELTAKFYKCDLTQAVFEKTNFYFTYFNDSNLFEMIMADCGFDIAVATDCDLRGAKIINTKFVDFSIEDSFKRTRVNRNTFLGELNYNKKDPRELRFATETYVAFNELFENDKVSSLSGEYFYLFKRTELLSLKGLSKIGSILSYLICGYGERPFFSLIASFLLVVLCGTLYLFCGISTSDGILIFHPTRSNLFPSFLDLLRCCHFSLVTFATVGYGNVTPIGGSMVISAFEMVFGVILVGVWVSTLVRKMAR